MDDLVDLRLGLKGKLLFEQGGALGRRLGRGRPECGEESSGSQFAGKVENGKERRASAVSFVEISAKMATTEETLNLLDALAAIAPEEGAATEGEYDGKLPEFSDSEENPAPSTSRAVPSRSARGGKRRPIIATVNKKLVAVTKVVKKDSSAQLTPQALDAVMEKLGGIDASIKREDIPALLEKLQLDKAVLQGKKGLMGKGTKDMGSVSSCSLAVLSAHSLDAEITNSGKRNPSPSSTLVRLSLSNVVLALIVLMFSRG